MGVLNACLPHDWAIKGTRIVLGVGTVYFILSYTFRLSSKQNVKAEVKGKLSRGESFALLSQGNQQKLYLQQKLLNIVCTKHLKLSYKENPGCERSSIAQRTVKFI